MLYGQVIYHCDFWSMVGLSFRDDIVKKVTCLLAEGHIGHFKMWPGIMNSGLVQAKNCEFLGHCRLLEVGGIRQDAISWFVG